MSVQDAVAYHLRPNKTIDRHVFIDLLTRIQGFASLHDYEYFGFGGPYLEDFRLIHAHFGIKRMTSVEFDEEVVKRQKFNKPLTCITCKLQTSGDFVTTYNSKRNAVVWLDYAMPHELRTQFLEFQALLPKLRDGDIVKVTVNAHPTGLGSKTPQPGEVVTAAAQHEYRFEVLKDRIGEFLPHEATADRLTHALFPSILLEALLRCANLGLKGQPVRFLPLTAFAYADGQAMLTFTGIVIDPTREREFMKRSRLADWALFLASGKAPIHILVPDLSTRERLYVDALLPKLKPDAILRKMKYRCGNALGETLEMLTSYATFYRHYPYFSRIVP